MKKSICLLFLMASLALRVQAQDFFTDPSRSYSSPLWTSVAGKLYLTWSEKEADGLQHFCMAISQDQGQHFSEKRVIASGYGLSNARLMKAKLLAKKDGSLWAVFMFNPNAEAGKPSRGGQVHYAVSKDEGKTWTKPAPVDQDPSPNLMRGFFDAVVLANDEVAVAYLKDVKGSTKHEERDLRMSITKNGKFQAEQLLDPVVCDCCNIGLLVDDKGVLNVYYRDNNNDIRDFSHMASADHGKTFSKPRNVYKDEWQIAGCPHNGAFPSNFQSQNYIAWFSGSEKERGVKLVTQEGKKVALLEEPSARNFGLAKAKDRLVFFWEEVDANTKLSRLSYLSVKAGKASPSQGLALPAGLSNASMEVLGNEALLAFELKKDNRTQIQIQRVSIN